ncbi:MAG: hypothetical protein Q8R08_03320 [bacterium]|nr:hypothetical protein [bacterium]
MGENSQNHDQEFQEEYKHFEQDVKKVIITNVLILALLIGTYFANKSTGFVDKLLNLIK